MKLAVLSGGVGGARFLAGLARAVPPDDVVAIVNTGDDFEHWGLWISPDVDSVVYGLAGRSDAARGWGLAGETFRALEGMRELGEADWFALGDRDLATHLARTRALRAGERLTSVTARIARALGVRARVLPMSDEPCRTMIETRDDGDLPFQTWFVQKRAEPAVARVRFDGGAATPEVLEALGGADAILVAPSNPYVSIDPILSLAGVREAVFARPVVAVSPLVGGRAIKGPLASMVPALSGEPASARAIARHYARRAAPRPARIGLVVDEQDVVDDVPCLATNVLMTSVDAAAELARRTVAFAERLA